jgi:hypothetical protein
VVKDSCRAAVMRSTAKVHLCRFAANPDPLFGRFGFFCSEVGIISGQPSLDSYRTSDFKP